VSTRTKVIALLSLPAGVAGYQVSARLLGEWGAPEILVLFLPLLIGGLCMAPFLVPFFDQMARRDLAALQAQRDAEARDGVPTEPPPD
jgi:hypothetical protein